MTEQPDLSSPEAAHRYFSAYCFNRTWDLLEKPDRTPADDEEMIQSCLASLWHWSQRPDCTAREKSIGTWQAARVYAVLKQAEFARRYAEMALEYAQNQPPFYRAYAYEALARSAAAAGSRDQARKFLELSQVLASQVEDDEDRALILADLQTIV
jgi:hypothetical protein